MNAPEPESTAELSSHARNIVLDGRQGQIVVDHHDTVGGLPVLLVHADAGNASQWREVIARLAGQRPTAAVNLRGHGPSSPARNADYSYEGRAEDLIAVLDTLDWHRVVVVTHSGGGPVALAFAASHGDQVAGIVMVDPPTDPAALPEEVRHDFVARLAGPDSLSYLREYYRGIAGHNPQVRRRVLADIEATDTPTRAGLGASMANWDPRASLAAYRGPLYVIGADATDGPHAVYRLRDDIPHTVVHGTGHWIQLERPEAVVNALTDFLESTIRLARSRTP